LLYANGNQGQFVFEARKYKECCDLSFDADWVWICDMGLELDPGNSLFRVSATRPGANNSQVHTAQVETTGQDDTAQADTTSQDRTAQADTTSQDDTAQAGTTSQDRAAQVDSEDETNRRSRVERRTQDRRTGFSAWFGKENRKFPRRQKYRRELDLEARKKK
jgi:hypothetical protein